MCFPGHRHQLRRVSTRLLLLSVILAALIDPALANKFETISGGVSGSFRFKQEWLQVFFLVAGGLSVLGAVLAVVVPHRNALYMNFSTWKQSAVVLVLLAVVFFGVAALL